MPSQPIRTPTDPQGRYVEGHQILTLTDQLNESPTYEAAAQATEHVLDPGDGVLVRLGQFFEAAAEQAQACETDEGRALAQQFEDAVAALADLEEDLHATPGQLRSLGPDAPSRQASAARSHTTAHQRPTAPPAPDDGVSRTPAAPVPHARRTR